MKKRTICLNTNNIEELVPQVNQIYTFGYISGIIPRHVYRKSEDDDVTLTKTTTLLNTTNSISKDYSKHFIGPVANGGGGGSKRFANSTESNGGMG